MNFFESQERARSHTALLVVLLALAVVALIVMTNLLVMVVFGYIDSAQMQGGGTIARQMDWRTFAAVSAGVGIVVLAGSLYKIMVLSAGGKVVAEALGGQLIPQNTDNLKQRKLLNVVEEMAIAAGTPAPPVYLLANEPGINAFAAGFSPRDAVIGVTQGAIDHLTRDQLQGVIAHEFSHIFNGDMRLNIRLIGILNGILIIGLAGYYLMYSMSYSRRGRGSGKNAGGILMLAIGLMVIGFAGTFFGNLIKAAVSRQREYLADASAVQFTRNPDGIAGALKRIGGLESGSRVESRGAPEVSHAFFAKGVSGFTQALAATHPPLPERILRIDPHWDGKFLSSDEPELFPPEEKTAKQENISRQKLAATVGGAAAGAAIAGVAEAMSQIGNPRPEAIEYARVLLSELPEGIREAAREPYGARAVIYSLVLDKGQDERDRQFEHLRKLADPDVFALTRQLLPAIEGLDIKFRLPIIEISIPALKQLSLDQYRAFRDNLTALIKMDSRIDLLEWSLQKILFNHLDGQFFKLKRATPRYARDAELKQEISLMLSVMAHAGHQGRNDIEVAFRSAATTLDISGLQLIEQNEGSLSDMDHALKKLEAMKPLTRLQLLKACATSVLHDRIISPQEIELLRAFSGALDCPMPPLVPMAASGVVLQADS